MLCLPLLKQTRLVGVLYLENNLTPHVFTPARMAILKLLASEAAISLENTRLYGDLQEREARVRRLVDSNIVGVLIWDFDGQILEANDAFLDMLQYGREDLVSGGVRWTDLTPSEWRERDERAMADLRSTGTVRPYEKEFLRKDGSRVPVLTGGALFDARGNDGVAFALDLSEQKHAEAEIRALKDQLYRENLALRDEVDRALMFEEIVGSSKTLKTALFPNRQGGSDRLDRVHLGRDWHRQGTHRPRRPQTIPEVWTCLRQRELCRAGAHADLLRAVRP